MFRITAKEVRWVLLGLIFGMASWFVSAGARDWFIDTFPNVSTIWIGLGAIFILLLGYRYVGGVLK